MHHPVAQTFQLAFAFLQKVLQTGLFFREEFQLLLGQVLIVLLQPQVLHHLVECMLHGLQAFLLLNEAQAVGFNGRLFSGDLRFQFCALVGFRGLLLGQLAILYVETLQSRFG